MAAVRQAAPDGVHVVVEVAPAANAALNHAVLAPAGTVAAYAIESPADLAVPVWPLMAGNIRYQFVLVYTVPAAAKDRAVAESRPRSPLGRCGDAPGARPPLHRR